MDIALVTGADAGPGLAIARRLIGMGCRVYALATQFARNPFPHDDFITLTCDLADPAAVTKAAEDVLAREGHVTFVVHAARRSPAPLFDTPVAELAARINVGLVAPLALARAVLPALRHEKGHFVVLCWNGDGAAPGGPVTAAIEGGLHHFTEELFNELRGDGVRATTVYARPNPETSAEAALALDPQSAVNPELLADAVEHLLRLRPSNAVSTIIIRPAAAAETPRIARSTELAGITTREVQLPPRQNFPREPELIPTPERQRPADAPPPGAEDYDDEEEEEDDWDPESEPLPWAKSGEPPSGESQDARRHHDGPLRPPEGRQDGRQQDNRQDYGPRQGQGPSQGGQGRGRGGRGRRRGGRGRGRGDYQDRPPGSPPNQGDQRPYPPRPASQYPDAEREAEQRAQARAERFRAPHDDVEQGPPSGEPSVEGDEPGDDVPNRDTDFEASPPRDEREDFRREDDRPPANTSRDDSRPPAGGNQPGNQNQRPQGHGHGQRRHRRPSLRPLPGSGQRRGPDAE